MECSEKKVLWESKQSKQKTTQGDKEKFSRLCFYLIIEKYAVTDQMYGIYCVGYDRFCCITCIDFFCFKNEMKTNTNWG